MRISLILMIIFLSNITLAKNGVERGRIRVGPNFNYSQEGKRFSCSERTLGGESFVVMTPSLEVLENEINIEYKYLKLACAYNGSHYRNKIVELRPSENFVLHANKGLFDMTYDFSKIIPGSKNISQGISSFKFEEFFSSRELKKIQKGKKVKKNIKIHLVEDVRVTRSQAQIENYSLSAGFYNYKLSFIKVNDKITYKIEK